MICPSVFSTTTTTPIGRLDIHAMDPTCPSWVKLQSIEYGTPLPNVALNKTALESSTFTHWQGQPTGHSASQAVDGNDQISTHTKCNQGYNQWWQVDLEEMYSIHSMEIKNSNSMQHRLHDYDIFLMDSNMTVVDRFMLLDIMGIEKQSLLVSYCSRVCRREDYGSNSYHLKCSYHMLTLGHVSFNTPTQHKNRSIQCSVRQDSTP